MVGIAVSTGPDGNWTTIRSDLDHKADTEIIVQPKSTARLMVRMDSFLPFVKKFKLGRVLLENGEIASFELRDLLPP